MKSAAEEWRKIIFPGNNLENDIAVFFFARMFFKSHLVDALFILAYSINLSERNFTQKVECTPNHSDLSGFSPLNR